MKRGIFGCLLQRFYDMRRRRLVGVALSEVDDVMSLGDPLIDFLDQARKKIAKAAPASCGRE